VEWDFGYCGHNWPIVPAPVDRWWWLWRNWWNEDCQEKPKYSEKNLPQRHFVQCTCSYCFFYYYYLVCEAIGTVASRGLLWQPRVIVKIVVEKQMECRLAGETEVFSEKSCPSATFVHHKIPHDQTRVWTRAAAVGSRRLLFYFYCLFRLWGYCHCGHSWSIVPASGDSEDGCGETDGM
jgi:hypothetical protein